MVGRKWWAAENAPAEQGRGGRRLPLFMVAGVETHHGVKSCQAE